MVAKSKPQATIILARISSDPDATEKGVTDQVADGKKLARRLGWRVGPEVTHVVVENDTSAFKRRRIRLPDGRFELRTVRPGFRRALDLLASGQADGLIAVDLDRTARDPRDLEDLIDVVESRTPRIPVESVTGSLKLANDADVAMARVMVAMANKSSRDTSRRVARARLRQAEEGRFGGGARRYGHEFDGSVRESEAAEIRKAADALLAGVGLRRIVIDLNVRGVPSARGGKWVHASLRDLVLQPRLAGLMAFGGEIIEDAPPFWEPILERSQWEAVRALLTSPDRRTSPGPTPRHLLSHLAVCGHPWHHEDDRPVLVHGWSGGNNGPRIPAYKCMNPAGHLTCSSVGLDEFVEDLVIERMSRPEAVELLTPHVEVDTVALSKQANSLRARIGGLGDALEAGAMPPAEYKVRRQRLAEQLADIEAKMTEANGTSPLVGLAGNPDADKAWADLDLGHKRAVIECLMTITVLPARKRGAGFDPERVRIDWKE
jgi:DNA invertase Pin-like site-specific DNA recombinase